MAPRPSSTGAGPFRTLALALLALIAAPAAADEGPAWLAPALARPVTLEATRSGAIVLELEHRVVMTEPGRVVRHEHGAVRVLSRDGAGAASAVVLYRTDGGRVRDLRGWLVSPAGTVTRLTSRHETDRALLGDDLYNEARLRILDPGPVPDGTVFAYEWTLEQAEPFAQIEWEFQDEASVAVARFVLETPPGWSVTARMVNHPAVAAQQRGAARVWEVAELPEVQDEPLAPSREARVPRIAVSAAPASGGSAAPTFASWAEVARWLAEVAARAGEGDESVRQRAAQLVGGARSEMDTLRRIARFVQGLRYASIQLGVSRGGGYQPRPPAQVLARAYGDCKDKANLMRALLAAVGRRSHLLVLHLGDPAYVRAEWQSPSPFNHCILAIPTRSAGRLPAEIEDERGGRLLIFDPTDPYTPLGDLSSDAQGGFALVLAPETSRLLRLPELPPEASSVAHHLEIDVDASGAATGTLTERSVGQAAVAERALIRGYDPADYRSAVVAWMRRAMSGAELDAVDVLDDSLSGRFETRVRFRVPRFGQILQQRLLVIRPPLLTRLGAALAADRPRRYPVLLPSRVAAETLVVRVPEGFAVDELPDTTTLEGPFARFTARAVVAGTQVSLARGLTTRRGELPANEYERVRTFYARVRAAEEAPIVFARP